MLIQQALVNNQPLDVRFDTQIQAIAPSLNPQPGEPSLQGQGLTLLPGLHDHHLHFRALAATRASVHCGPPQVATEAGLVAALQTATGTHWIRGVGYFESVAGELDRHWLDRHLPDRPVRIQHRTGKCWILNSAGLAALELSDQDQLDGIERDQRGEPTGRLFRLDDWLAQRLQHQAQLDVSGTSLHLARLGITGFTDTSATNDLAAVDWFRSAASAGHLRQRATLMGDASLTVGHLKILLDEDNLPDIDNLCAKVKHSYAMDRPVAFHCVTETELVFAVAVLDAVGYHHANRIEHGSLISDALLAPLRDTGACVVTQPGFIRHRGDQYQQDLTQEELANLYRYQSLIDHGIPVACSSDAPYGPESPWQVMRSAVNRQTPQGEVLGSREAVTETEALRSYLSCPNDPAGPARTITVGAPADLVLINLSEATSNPVRQTFIGGRSLLNG